MASTKKITLRSSDGNTFEVDEAVALQSQTIEYIIEDVGANNEIPVPNVTGKILSKVIDFCELTDCNPEATAWHEAFVEVGQAVLFDLIMAANYLNIKSLLDLTCQTVVDMMKGKSAEEIRKIFNIVNDYTPEEEEELPRKYPWAFAGEEEEEEVEVDVEMQYMEFAIA